LQALQGELAQRDEKLREKETKQQELLLALVEKKIRLQEVSATLTVNKREIDLLHQSNSHWWSMAEQQGKELQAVYSSKYWRITLPLRKLMQLSKWLIAITMRITLWLVRLPKRSAHWLLIKAMVYTLKHPELKKRSMVWVRNYPKMEAKLRRIAQARALFALLPGRPSMPAQSRPESPMPESAVTKNEDITLSSNLLHLTPSARGIYTELKAAIEKSRKKND